MNFGSLISLAVNIFRPSLGKFGDFEFEVSSMAVVTFKDFEQSSSAKYARHQLLGHMVPEHEFTGIGTQKITLTIPLSKQLGVKAGSSLLEKAMGQLFGANSLVRQVHSMLSGSADPDNDVASKLHIKCMNGEPEYLIVGNVRIGAGWKYVITDVTSRKVLRDTFGRVIYLELDVTFEAYI